MEVVIQEKVAQKESELNAAYDEKIRNYQERCVLFASLLHIRLQSRRRLIDEYDMT